MPIITIIFRLLLSTFLGCMIGIERERVHKAAGVRTLGIVSLGTTLFTLMSVYGFNELSSSVDPTRIAAQVVTGIGFLGAGLIIFHQDRIHNLTTAATIWVVAAISMAVGIGWYVVAIVATVLTLAVVLILRLVGIDRKIEGNK